MVPPDSDSYTIHYNIDDVNGMKHSSNGINVTVGTGLDSTQSGSGTQDLVYQFTGVATPTMLIEIIKDFEVVASQNFSITVK